MNSQEFVEAIKRHVVDAAVEDTIANLMNPPGRRVSPHERGRSDWYNGLSEEDVAHVNSVIATSVHEGIFGLLAVLDGARTVDEEKGLFELTYVGSQRVLLNDPQDIGLHDLLNAAR